MGERQWNLKMTEKLVLSKLVFSNKVRGMEMTERLQKVLDYIDAHREEYIEELRQLCRQPSLAVTGEGIPETIRKSCGPSERISR